MQFPVHLASAVELLNFGIRPEQAAIPLTLFTRAGPVDDIRIRSIAPMGHDASSV